MKLTSKNVSEIFFNCIMKNNERKDCVISKGIVVNVGFNPKRLEEYEDDIYSMLLQLPDTFINDGWSFINMGVDNNNEIWTGQQKVMEQLLLMGLAIGKMEYCLDRSLWSLMPGSVPYIRVLK